MKIVKHIYEDNEKYCNHNKLLSVKADISISQSIRNLGKSYDAMRLAIKCLENGKNIAWCRWDLNEMAIAYNEFSEKLDELKYKPFSVKNSKIIGFVNMENGAKLQFYAVKSAMSYKGSDIKLDWLIYDEFIPEMYDIKTRRDTEFNKFMSLYVTLKRDYQKFRCLLISNCIDWFNGYTKGWKIYPFPSGEIRIYDRELLIDIDGKTVSAKTRVAFENVKPSHAMIQRVIKEQIIKGGEVSEIKSYLENETSIQYNLIGKCPNPNIPLEPIQFRRNKDYFSFRKYDGIYYFVKVKKRDTLPVYIFSLENAQPDEIREKQHGVIMEELINRSLCRFYDGHVYNNIIMGIWELRKRI